MNFPELNLPTYQFQLSREGKQVLIYDMFRRKKVVLTPEEWVRQNFLRYLMDNYNYPKSLIKVEGGLKYNTRAKRSDILIYTSEGNPKILVECKRQATKINQSVFDQAAIYNQKIKAPFIIVTNGMEHYCCAINIYDNTYQFLEDIPRYK